MTTSSQTNNFINGLVFGFDVGTGSIGWAVRRGAEFLDVGVLICPEDTNDLSDRRNLRRQRRTLRNRKYRRKWFAIQLAEILGLELHKDGAGKINLPKTAWEKNAKGGWAPKPGFKSLLDPIALRVRAIGDPLHLLPDTERNKPLMAEELHAALSHLFKRRGYEASIPWADRDDHGGEKKSDDEWDSDTIPPDKVESEFASSGCDFPSEFLYCQTKRRKRVWPRRAAY